MLHLNSSDNIIGYIGLVPGGAATPSAPKTNDFFGVQQKIMVSRNFEPRAVLFKFLPVDAPINAKRFFSGSPSIISSPRSGSSMIF